MRYSLARGAVLAVTETPVREGIGLRHSAVSCGGQAEVLLDLALAYPSGYRRRLACHGKDQIICRDREARDATGREIIQTVSMTVVSDEMSGLLGRRVERSTLQLCIARGVE